MWEVFLRNVSYQVRKIRPYGEAIFSYDLVHINSFKYSYWYGKKTALTRATLFAAKLSDCSWCRRFTKSMNDLVERT